MVNNCHIIFDLRDEGVWLLECGHTAVVVNVVANHDHHVFSRCVSLSKYILSSFLNDYYIESRVECRVGAFSWFMENGV